MANLSSIVFTLAVHVLPRAASCRGVKQPKGKAAYIKISEEEIADDYPLPQQYPMEEEELDEFVVNGDDDVMLDVDPESLPKMVHCSI